jgi:hypothetical protein
MAAAFVLALALLQDRTTLVAVPAERPPEVDGSAEDACWANAPELLVRVARATFPGRDRYDVSLRAVTHGETIYILASWPDPRTDQQHKPYVWSEEAGTYVVGEELEDGFAFAFPIRGRFTADMYAPEEAVWDVWQWGAARTNPSGYALDRTHAMTLRRPREGGRQVTARNNEPLWILRAEDQGTPCYERRRPPGANEGERVAQFVTREPSGSCADVRAHGRHADGRWTVEFARALNTRNRDDRAFRPGEEVPFGICTFDAEEDVDHRVSSVLTLRIGR